MTLPTARLATEPLSPCVEACGAQAFFFSSRPPTKPDRADGRQSSAANVRPSLSQRGNAAAGEAALLAEGLATGPGPPRNSSPSFHAGVTGCGGGLVGDFEANPAAAWSIWMRDTTQNRLPTTHSSPLPHGRSFVAARRCCVGQRPSQSGWCVSPPARTRLPRAQGGHLPFGHRPPRDPALPSTARKRPDGPGLVRLAAPVPLSCLAPCLLTRPFGCRACPQAAQCLNYDSRTSCSPSRCSSNGAPITWHTPACHHMTMHSISPAPWLR